MKYKYAYMFKETVMSFIDQILEERKIDEDIEAMYEEFVQLTEQMDKIVQLNEQLAKNNRINEGAMDFGNRTDPGEIFDEAMKRFKTAKWAFGLTNKLRKPEDKKKHRRNIMIVMNQLRALINRLIKQLTVEVEDGGDNTSPRMPSREGNYSRSGSEMNQNRPAMAT